jgi:CheY-like chemotaxis protein
MDESGQIKSCLRVLHLEDNAFDAELIRTQLENHNIPCVFTQIQTRAAFEAALQQGGVDLILSDSQLPGFDTMSALTFAQQTRPELPFIFLCGTVPPGVKGEAFRRGAVDFIDKDHLPKLARVIYWLFFASERRGRKPSLPIIGEPVMVQSKGFRCLGYLDRNGEWRDFGTSGKLSEVIDWREL